MPRPRKYATAEDRRMAAASRAAERWKERAFNEGIATYGHEAKAYVRALRAEGRPYYSHHPIPPHGYLEYGRAAGLVHKRDGSVKLRPRKFVERYDPTIGQVVLLPARHMAAPRKVSAEVRERQLANLAKGRAMRSAKAGIKREGKVAAKHHKREMSLSQARSKLHALEEEHMRAKEHHRAHKTKMGEAGKKRSAKISALRRRVKAAY
jgi:hypothetical protein